MRLLSTVRAFRLRRAAAAALAAAVVCAAPAVLGVAALGASPAEASDRPISLAYRFYVGGVLIGKATVSGVVGENGYAISSDASTTGAAGWLFKATFRTAAEGARTPRGGVTPGVFRLDTLSGRKPQDVVMTYGKRAPETVEATPPFGARPYELDPRKQRGTFDPISGALAGALQEQGRELCRQKVPMYDGRRRYDLILEGVKAERVRDGAPTVDCRARWTRVGGFKPKFMSRPDYTFTVRFRIEPDGFAVPIRAWGDTEFGAAIAVIRKK